LPVQRRSLAPVTENITPEREVAEAISLLKQT
jgi:hypothetical protein